MRSTFLTGSVVALALISWCAGAYSQTDDRKLSGEITLQNSGGTYVVPVRVNNAITLKFVIDSGASDVQIPVDVFTTLMRTDTISKDDLTGFTTYTLADGSSHREPTFVIKYLQIGNLVLHDVSANVSPADSSLLLGESFLSRFESWTLDNRDHVLKFVATLGANGASASSDHTTTDIISTYDLGVSDWKKVHAWLSNQSGARRAGAYYWVMNRNVPNHLSCSEAALQTNNDDRTVAEFVIGCSSAAQLLGPIDLKREDSGYHKGFNDEARLLPFDLRNTSISLKNATLCGRTIPYTENDQTISKFLGTWSGNWDMRGHLCGGLIITDVDEDGRAALIYVYGPSYLGSGVSWKEQKQVGFIHDNFLEFKDDQGSIFKFRYSQDDTLHAIFTGGTGQLSGYLKEFRDEIEICSNCRLNICIGPTIISCKRSYKSRREKWNYSYVRNRIQKLYEKYETSTEAVAGVCIWRTQIAAGSG